jgi:mannitol-specific phosphotransferase system IIBC component
MNYENKPKKREVKRTNKDGVKTKQVLKNGVVKKTVTRTPGGVEKEIERGNKRIEVDKYKDEGVKTRTVTNMKKNNKYKENNAKAIMKAATTGMLSGMAGAADFISNLKSSTFNNIPKQMFDNANSSQNTQIDGKISESKPLTTPEKKLMNVPYEMLKGTLDKMSTEGGFKTTPKTGKITKNK